MTDDVRVYWADMTPTEQVMAEQVARMQVRAHAAEEAVERVRELHRRTSQGWCWECVEHAYPCATVLTLDGAE